MSVLKIVLYGDPVLTTAAKPVMAWDDDLRKLAADMLETMYAARGVGLAAPQVGRSIALAVIDVTEPSGNAPQPIIMTNPVMIACSGFATSSEGCLSIPYLFCVMERPAHVTVKYQDLDGWPQKVSGSDLLARALCHEVDHLDGKLFYTRVAGLTDKYVQEHMTKVERARGKI